MKIKVCKTFTRVPAHPKNTYTLCYCSSIKMKQPSIALTFKKKNKKANSKNHDICKKKIIATKVVIIFISVQKHH